VPLADDPDFFTAHNQRQSFTVLAVCRALGSPETRTSMDGIAHCGPGMAPRRSARRWRGHSRIDAPRLQTSGAFVFAASEQPGTAIFGSLQERSSSL
jgi:hypothetical protein